MDIIHHRCNSIDKLISVNTDLGVEVDVRSFGERLILNHDPYKDSQSLMTGYQTSSIKYLY